MLPLPCRMRAEISELPDNAPGQRGFGWAVYKTAALPAELHRRGSAHMLTDDCRDTGNLSLNLALHQELKIAVIVGATPYPAGGSSAPAQCDTE